MAHSAGRWAMVGAGAVITHDVPDFGLVYGNPARLHGFVYPCACRLIEEVSQDQDQGEMVLAVCPRCGSQLVIPLADHQRNRVSLQ